MLLAAALCVGAVHPLDRYARPGQMVEVEPGRRINLRCDGRGSPTILLESGLDWPSLSWRKVQPALARLTRTCSYDRAGLGFSDPGPLPRRAGVITDDLDRLVRRGAIKAPFLLIGNSLGGQSPRLFAFRRPGEILGLILLDPYVEGQYPILARIEPLIAVELATLSRDEQACVQALRTGALAAAQAEVRDCVAAPDPSFPPQLAATLRRQRMGAAWYEAAYSESLMLDTQSEEDLARERRDLSPVPILVLSAARNFASPRFARTRAALLAKQTELHHSLAALSGAGRVREVDAAHAIQASEPDLLVAAVREMLAARRPSR